MKKLTLIANKHKCDKGTEAYEAHGYTEEYDKYIPEEGAFTVLEIGVWKGDSLRMWKEYNSNLSIYGLDVDENIKNYMNVGDPVTLIGDATDLEFLDMTLSTSGPPDFIIDDGSHRYEDILASFKYLYPRLKKGGFYFIEDLHASQSNREELLVKLGTYLSEHGNSSWDLVSNSKLLIIQK